MPIKDEIIFLSITFLTLIYFSPTLFPQNNTSVKFKTEAVELINSGRYGEAIDILNKYVSANPNSAYGFNLRGMCYEKEEIMSTLFMIIAQQKNKSNR